MEQDGMQGTLKRHASASHGQECLNLQLLLLSKVNFHSNLGGCFPTLRQSLVSMAKDPRPFNRCHMCRHLQLLHLERMRNLTNSIGQYGGVDDQTALK
jgi:hypothetical protein